MKCSFEIVFICSVQSDQRNDDNRGKEKQHFHYFGGSGNGIQWVTVFFELLGTN